MKPKDLIELDAETGIVRVITKTTVEINGESITKSHPRSLKPLQNIDNESALVKQACAMVRTPEIVTAASKKVADDKAQDAANYKEILKRRADKKAANDAHIKREGELLEAARIIKASRE